MTEHLTVQHGAAEVVYNYVMQDSIDTGSSAPIRYYTPEGIEKWMYVRGYGSLPVLIIKATYP